MPLHPQVEAARARRERAGVAPLYTLPLAEARAADLASIQAGGGAAVPVREVWDEVIPGPEGPVPIRRYRPSAADALPTLVYFFGGGWTLGNLDTSDNICRALATSAGCQVIAVGYRLAPEAKFPAAVHDCAAAVEWIAAHATEIGADPDRLAVGGDSAGGNLAAAVTLLAAGRGGPKLVGQLLVYPNTDYGAQTQSMRDNADPLMFNRNSVSWYWSHYLADPADGAHPLASPMRAPDLTGLPPALVITAEYDPLRDEAEAYAERLRACGVPVTLTRYDGMAHGFFAMAGDLEAGRAAQDQAAAQLVAWFTGPSHDTHPASASR